MANQQLAAADGIQQPLCVTQTMHGNAGIAWISSDMFASGNDSGDIVLWQLASDRKSTQQLARFGEHTQPVTALAAGPQATLASTSLDGTAKLWQASVAGGPVATFDHLPVHAWCDVHVHAAAWVNGAAQHTLATAASDGVVRLWDVRRAPASADRFSAHSAPLLALANGIAECQLLAAGECGSLLLLDTRQLDAPVATVQVSASSAVSAIAPGGHGSAEVAVGTEDGTIAQLDARDLHVVSHVRTHQGRVSALAWLVGPSSGDGGGELLSGGWDKQLLRQRMSKA